MYFFNYKLNTNYKSNSEPVRIRVRILAEHILTEHFQYFTSVDKALATLLSRIIGLPLLVVSKVPKGSSIVRKYGDKLMSTVLF